MEQPKSPPTRSRSKKYDFETPLDPFEGESLKGIAAFIESSLTLQSPTPAAETDSEPQRQIEGMPAALPEAQLEPREARQDEAILSTPYTHISRTHDTHISSTPSIGMEGIVTSTPSTANGDISKDPQITTSARGFRHDSVEIRENTEGKQPNEVVIGVPDTNVDGGIDTGEIGVPNTSKPGTPITAPDSTDVAGRLDPHQAALLTTANTTDLGVLSTLSPNDATQANPDTQGEKTAADRADVSGILRVPNTLDAQTRAQTESEIPASAVRVLNLKIHSATRGQDGLTKGEEKIYTFLWRAAYRRKDIAKPEFRTDSGRIEISLRDLAKRVGLGLANCAWHVRGLEEKGCIEKVRQTDHYHPAVYYVREFSDIIEWRNTRGLTHFIQRGHLAAFVDPKTGVPITRFRGQTSTIYRGKLEISTPNTQTNLGDHRELGVLNTPKGVLNSRIPSVIDSSTLGVIDSSTQLNINIQTETSNKHPPSSTSAEVPSELIAALQRIAPTVDHEAATILWNDCRAKAIDCTPQEVLYFTNAKAAILASGRITNPIGFLLAAVPKCFEGETFRSFRRDQARHREELLRREAEERNLSQKLEQEARREAETHRLAEEALAQLTAQERNDLYEQVKTELHLKYPRVQWPNRQALEDRIRLGMIRHLQKGVRDEG